MKINMLSFIIFKRSLLDILKSQYYLFLTSIFLFIAIVYNFFITDLIKDSPSRYWSFLAIWIPIIWGILYLTIFNIKYYQQKFREEINNGITGLEYSKGNKFSSILLWKLLAINLLSSLFIFVLILAFLLPHFFFSTLADSLFINVYPYSFFVLFLINLFEMFILLLFLSINFSKTGTVIVAFLTTLLIVSPAMAMLSYLYISNDDRSNMTFAYNQTNVDNRVKLFNLKQQYLNNNDSIIDNIYHSLSGLNDMIIAHQDKFLPVNQGDFSANRISASDFQALSLETINEGLLLDIHNLINSKIKNGMIGHVNVTWNNYQDKIQKNFVFQLLSFIHENVKKQVPSDVLNNISYQGSYFDANDNHSGVFGKYGIKWFINLINQFDYTKFLSQFNFNNNEIKELNKIILKNVTSQFITGYDNLHNNKVSKFFNNYTDVNLDVSWTKINQNYDEISVLPSERLWTATLLTTINNSIHINDATPKNDKYQNTFWKIMRNPFYAFTYLVFFSKNNIDYSDQLILLNNSLFLQMLDANYEVTLKDSGRYSNRINDFITDDNVINITFYQKSFSTPTYLIFIVILLILSLLTYFLFRKRFFN